MYGSQGKRGLCQNPTRRRKTTTKDLCSAEYREYSARPAGVATLRACGPCPGKSDCHHFHPGGGGGATAAAAVCRQQRAPARAGRVGCCTPLLNKNLWLRLSLRDSLPRLKNRRAKTTPEYSTLGLAARPGPLQQGNSGSCAYSWCRGFLLARPRAGLLLMRLMRSPWAMALARSGPLTSKEAFPFTGSCSSSCLNALTREMAWPSGMPILSRWLTSSCGSCSGSSLREGEWGLERDMISGSACSTRTHARKQASAVYKPRQYIHFKFCHVGHQR